MARKAAGEVVCGKCGAVSSPARGIVAIHEKGCPESIEAKMERGGEGRNFRIVDVDGGPSAVYMGRKIPLLTLTNEELVGIIADLDDKQRLAKSAHEKTGKALKKAEADKEEAVNQLLIRYRNEKGQGKLEI